MDRLLRLAASQQDFDRVVTRLGWFACSMAATMTVVFLVAAILK
jgi:hypothetical protein